MSNTAIANNFFADLAAQKARSPLARSIAVMVSHGMSRYEISQAIKISLDEIDTILSQPETDEILRHLLSGATAEQLEAVLAAAAVDATLTIRHLLKCEKPDIALNASKYIIDRRLGLRKTNTKGTIDPNSLDDPDAAMQELDRQIAELKQNR